MDKAKTLEVLRGMKFMQRKEEAKRRATFEIAQRDEIERHLHSNAAGSGSQSGGASSAPSTARATILYDDGIFPISGYSLSRQTFADSLGETSSLALPRIESRGTTFHTDGAANDPSRMENPVHPSASSSSALPSDVSDVEDEDELEDPTSAPTRRGRTHAAGGPLGGSDERKDGRFVVASSVRAPKLPRRLQETVEEAERERKRRRAEDAEKSNLAK